ncbi:MAG: hypothetical protein PVG38_08835 [Gammaproteobacteria bacterium]|jgi:hypothetical protein
MIAIDTLLFGLVAGLIGFKLALLAGAALLFVHGLSWRSGRDKPSPMPAPAKVRQRKLDVHA